MTENSKNKNQLIIAGSLLFVILILISAAAFLKNKKESEASTPTIQNSFSLNDLMKFETINVNIEWLEKRIGPHKSQYMDFFNYEIDGCKVAIQTTKNEHGRSVDSISLEEMSPHCTFDSSQIGIGGPAHLLKFKDLAALGDWHALQTCLSNCGNAADPTYGMTVEGPRALQFMLFQGVNSYTHSAASADLLKKRVFDVVSPADHDDLDGGYIDKLITQENYDHIWLSVFKDETIKSIGFGFAQD
jgi:hypothetical protein